MKRNEIQSGWKKGKRFEGEGGAGAMHWQRRDQMDQVKQWRYTRWENPKR